MAWILTARLPRLFPTHFWVRRKKSHSCRFEITVVFIFILKMLYCGYSLELSRWGDSNENIQHTITYHHVRENQNDISILLLACAMKTLVSSNYPCLKHIFMVPKVFELLKFYCTFLWNNWFNTANIGEACINVYDLHPHFSANFYTEGQLLRLSVCFPWLWNPLQNVVRFL